MVKEYIKEKELSLIQQATGRGLQYQDLQCLVNKLHVEKQECSPAAEKIIDILLRYLGDTMSSLYLEMQVSNEKASARLAEAEKEAEEARIRADERECILNEVSHHIKNLVVSVVDPLRRLSAAETSDKKFIVDSALSGAEMIKNIVGCLNDSFRTTPEDLQYDLTHTEDNSPGFGVLLEEAFRFSVNNMFDGERHGKYVRSYFRSQENFKLCQNKWQNIHSISEMRAFVNEYMFDCEIAVPQEYDSMAIGNERGSATKMLILLNELLMNALKAMSQLNRTERKLVVNIFEDDGKMCWVIQNTYKKGSVSSSNGLGKTIIKKLIEGFGGTNTVEATENIFKATIKIILSGRD